MRDALNLSLTEVAEQIRKKEISPVELAEAALARIEATEGVLNAYVRINADHALAAAREAEAEIAAGRYRGELHGVPIAIKDLYDMAGLPTTCSSKVRHDHLADQDSACAARLKAAGATMEHVVKINLYSMSLDKDLEAVSEVRMKYFKGAPIASTWVEVTRLVNPDWLLEIEAIAVID